MTGKEKIEAAFSADDTLNTPVVIPYEGIFYRDHWSSITDRPWWHQYSPVLDHQHAVMKDIMEAIGQDWYKVPGFYTEEERNHIVLETKPDGVFLVNKGNEALKRLTEPSVGGWNSLKNARDSGKKVVVESHEDVERLIPDCPVFNPESSEIRGKNDLALTLRSTCGKDRAGLIHVSSPFWRCYGVMGFENMMILTATRPDLIKYACERFLKWAEYEIDVAAFMGADIVWIEECMTDMISPETFCSLNMPYLAAVIDRIRQKGMKSVYYYCGNPWDRIANIMSTGADAISFEESKKNFAIDIDDLVDAVNGRCTVLGNIDAIGVLQEGSEEELKAEITRQINAGKRNKGRFILSLGSPVTPETPVEKVRLYCELGHSCASA